MKAIITGTPLQLEGEPAEIAQLVEVLSSGTVLVEHVHKWRIGELTGEETVKGACWCGQERDFNPSLPEGRISTAKLGLNEGQPFDAAKEQAGIERRAAANAAGKRPFCEDCGRKHKLGNCTLRRT